VVSPKQRTTWIFLFLSFKWLVLNNGQLEFTFCQVVSPKQWTTWVYLSSLLPVVSPKQWTTWAYLSSCFKWLVLNNGQLEFNCLSFSGWSVPNNENLCLPVILSSVIPVCLVKRGLHWTIIPNQYNSTPPFPPVELHYPLVESDPFLNKFRYPIEISRPNQNVFAVLHS